MFSTIQVGTAANASKLKLIRDILTPFQRTMSSMVEHLDSSYQQGNDIPKYCPWHPSDLGSALSARMLQTACSQVIGQLKAYYSILENDIRDMITYSSLNEQTRTELYRINNRHAWCSRSLMLDWDVDTVTGELMYAAYGKGAVQLPVDAEVLKLARRLMKQARKHQGRPNMLRTHTLRLDAKVMSIQESKNSKKFEHWVSLNTMVRGKHVLLPLLENSYSKKATGVRKNIIQLGIHDDHLTIGLVHEVRDANTRKTGKSIGLDWGLTSLFTTSDGRLLGSAMLHRLRELDILLTDRARYLKKKNIPFKQDERWVSLNQRIHEYAVNEVNRILNRLTAADVRELVVEKLVFRNGGLSHRLNRILNRAGRQAVSRKLARLRETKGIITTVVNSAYTSQMCSSCGYVSKGNRKSQASFTCLCCGFKLNADVNAARNILGRRSPLTTGSTRLQSQRHSLLGCLLSEHATHCPTGKHPSDHKIIGLMSGLITPRALVIQSD
jgi:putative transposase